MKYRVIYEEYTGFLQSRSQIRFEISTLPKGSIVKKRISGKEYHYLQYTACGKKKTEYLRETEVPEVQSQLARSAKLKQELVRIDTEMNRIERAVEILDYDLSRTFVFLRQCSDMDAMPISKRADALSFARAMTALEGLPVQEDTEQNLVAWSRGEKSFADFYLPALQRYHVMEGAYET